MMGSLQWREERHGGVMLARAFAARRRRNPFHPMVWLGSEGIVAFLVAYALALVLLVSIAAVLSGTVMLVFALVLRGGGAMHGLRSDAGMGWVIGVGVATILPVLVVNKLLLMLLARLAKKGRQPAGALPFWVSELYGPQTPWRDSAREILLSGQSGLSVLAAMQAERGSLQARRTLVVGLFTYVLLLLPGIASIYYFLFVSSLAIPGIVLATVVTWKYGGDRKLRCMEILHRWVARQKGLRVYAQSGLVAQALFGVVVMSLLGACVSVSSVALVARAHQELVGAIALLAWFVGLAYLARRLSMEEIGEAEVAESIEGELINDCFERFVAEELTDDPDALAATRRVELPRRKEWQYPWDLFLDILEARVFPDGRRRR